MTLETIYYISQVASTLALMLSLIYLGRQISHSTRVSAVEAKLTTTAMLSGFADLLIDDPQLNDLVMRGMASTDDLTKEEYYRFSNMCFKVFWVCSTTRFQLRTGTLTSEDWFEAQSIFDGWLSGPGLRNWWRRTGRARFTGEFAGFVEAEIERIESMAPEKVRDAAGKPSSARDDA